MALRSGKLFAGKLEAGRLFGFGGAWVRFVLRMSSYIARVIRLDSKI